MKPTDISQLITVSSPVVTGTHTYAVLTRPHVESNTYTSQVFDCTSTPVRVSHGWFDTALDFAGNTFALLRADKKAPAQLFAGPHPGAVNRYTDFHLGVSAFALSPDGSTALVTARVPEYGRYGTDETRPAPQEAPRRIRRATYLANEVGYTRDRPLRAFLVDLSPRGVNLDGIAEVVAPTALSSPDGDVTNPAVGPDGQLSVIAPVSGTPDTHASIASTVWILKDTQPTELDFGQRKILHHKWLDADTLVAIAIELPRSDTDYVAQVPGLYLHTISTAETRRLTPTEHTELAGVLHLTDSHIYVTVTADGAERLASTPRANPGELTYLSDPQHVVTHVSTHGEEVTYAATTSASAGDLFTPSGQLTHLNSLPLTSTPEVLRVQGEAGEITGWVALPAGTGPFPVLLNIHGGPFSQFTHAFFDETQVFTEAGYAVVYANPRGSSGRGRGWGAAVQGDMAAPAMADVLAVLDAACKKYPLDRTRMGVEGGSYGGYLTAMISAHDHRFVGAVVERGYLDPISFIGTSDIGRTFTDEYLGRTTEDILRQSPMTHVDKVRTPTLVMHSEEDYRCPLGQGLGYYAALQRAGVQTELVIFPGENHELSRTGGPRHRVERFQILLDWWKPLLG